MAASPLMKLPKNVTRRTDNELKKPERMKLPGLFSAIYLLFAGGVLGFFIGWNCGKQKDIAKWRTGL
jgi:hypothetical protein